MKLKYANQFMQAVPIHVSEDHHFTLPITQAQAPPNQVPPINEAIRIRAAEYWLRLGEADETLRELENLPHQTWVHPFAVKIRVAALGTLRERSKV